MGCAIKTQIREGALFVPVLAQRQNREEGQFRLEWRITVDRMHDMDEDMLFLLLRVIDDTHVLSTVEGGANAENQGLGWDHDPPAHNESSTAR